MTGLFEAHQQHRLQQSTHSSRLPAGGEPSRQRRRLGFRPGQEGPLGFQSQARKIPTPWGRARQPTPVLLPGKSHGQRSLAGYNPWGHKEPDMTEQLNTYVSNRKQSLSVEISFVRNVEEQRLNLW